MFREEKLEKVILSREEYIWYQQRRKECKVYDSNEVQFRAFNQKKEYYNKR